MGKQELSGKQGRKELYCEGVRDIGILVAVFAPLDFLASRPLWSTGWLLFTILASFGLVIAGVELDPRSKAR